jgi:hypothetical protein
MQGAVGARVGAKRSVGAFEQATIDVRKRLAVSDAVAEKPSDAAVRARHASSAFRDAAGHAVLILPAATNAVAKAVLAAGCRIVLRAVVIRV